MNGYLTPAGLPAVFQRELNLWHYVWKLLRLRIVLYFSSFRRAKLRRKIFQVFLWVLVLAFFALMFTLSWFLLRFLNSADFKQFAQAANVDFASLIQTIPVLIISTTFLGILLTSFGVLLQALYLAGDMDFLLSAPIPIRAVFISKLLQAILPNFGLSLLLGLPVLFGLGLAYHYNLLYFPMVVIVMAVLALAAAGLSSLLVMAVVRVFPARRVAEVIGFIGAIVSITCSQSGNLINSMNLGKRNITTSQLPIAALTRLSTPLSPLSWGGLGLINLGAGHWLPALLYLALTLGLAGAAFMVSLSTAERLYYGGWANVQVGERRKKVARPAAVKQAGVQTTRTSLLAGVIAWMVPQDIRSMVRKDFIVLRRDLRNMSQIVTPLIFGVIYALMLFRGGAEAPVADAETPAFLALIFKNLLIYGNVGISLFVSWSLLSRLALMGFSMEGKQYWILKTAPVKTDRLILAKYLVAYLPSLALGWIFLLIISLLQRASMGVLFYGLAVTGLTIAGVAGMELAFGISGANLTWEDPRRMQQGVSSCLGSLASMAFLVLSLVLFFGPPILFLSFSLPELIGQGIGLLLGGVLSLAVGIVPIALVRSRVALIGEEK